MKKVILGLSALCMVAFTSCKDDAAAKVKTENVTQAAARDAVAADFPVLTFAELDHDFVIDIIFKIDGREKYIPG